MSREALIKPVLLAACFGCALAPLWPRYGRRLKTGLIPIPRITSCLSCFYCLGIQRAFRKKARTFMCKVGFSGGNGAFRGKGLRMGHTDKNFDLGSESGVYGRMVVRRGPQG